MVKLRKRKRRRLFILEVFSLEDEAGEKEKSSGIEDTVDEGKGNYLQWYWHIMNYHSLDIEIGEIGQKVIKKIGQKDDGGIFDHSGEGFQISR